MRLFTGGMLILACAAWAAGQPPVKPSPGKRYGVELNTAKYPQGTPQEALGSVLRALETGKVHYLLAQLADPDFVDRRVSEYQRTIPRGSDEAKALLAFDRFLADVKAHYEEDPTLVKDLYRLAREGEWQGTEQAASIRLKSSPDRGAFFLKIQDRWFLLNRQSEDADKKGG